MSKLCKGSKGGSSKCEKVTSERFLTTLMGKEVSVNAAE